MKNILISIVLFIGFISASFTHEQQDIKASIQRGKKVYEVTCLACHQPTGEGVPRMNPPLIKTKMVLGAKEKLVKVIIKGLDEEIEINGEYYNNPMPAQPQLSNQEIADVLTYVRNSFGNKATAVTVAEVITTRKKINNNIQFNSMQTDNTTGCSSPSGLPDVQAGVGGKRLLFIDRDGTLINEAPQPIN